MKPTNPVTVVPTYAPIASYKEMPGQSPESDEYKDGVIPLDTLPAAWWNWLWNQITLQEGNTVSALNNIFAEIINVLTDAGITPADEDTTQLKQAIYALSQRIATASVAGAVKSSSTNGQITVEADGTMTANGLGNVSNLTTEAKLTVVAAINEIHSLVNTNIESITNILNKIGDLTTVPGNPASVAVGLQSLHSSVSSLSSSVTGSFASFGSSLSSVSETVANSSANWNDAYDKVTLNSSIWGAAGTQGGWANSSASWNSAYNSVKDNSAGWADGSAAYNLLTSANGITASSSNWNAASVGSWLSSVSSNYWTFTSQQGNYGTLVSYASSKNADAAKISNQLNRLLGYFQPGAIWVISVSGNASSARAVNASSMYVSAALGREAYATVNASSANWGNAYNSVKNSSANWGGAYNSLTSVNGINAKSAGWQNAVVSVVNSSANWGNGYLSAGSAYNSAYSAYSTVVNSSNRWESAYTRVTNQSAGWAGGSAANAAVNNSSANWNKGYNGYDSVSKSSNNWQSGYSGYTCVVSYSNSWISAYNSVNSSSNRWESAYTKITASSINIATARSVGVNIWIE